MGGLYSLLYLNSALLVDVLCYGLAYLLFPTIINGNCFVEGDLIIAITCLATLLPYLFLILSAMACESVLGEVLMATFFILVIEYGMASFLIVGFWPKILLPIIVTICWFFIAMEVLRRWIDWENDY